MCGLHTSLTTPADVRRAPPLNASAVAVVLPAPDAPAARALSPASPPATFPPRLRLDGLPIAQRAPVAAAAAARTRIRVVLKITDARSYSGATYVYAGVYVIDDAAAATGGQQKEGGAGGAAGAAGAAAPPPPPAEFALRRCAEAEQAAAPTCDVAAAAAGGGGGAPAPRSHRRRDAAADADGDADEAQPKRARGGGGGGGGGAAASAGDSCGGDAALAVRVSARPLPSPLPLGGPSGFDAPFVLDLLCVADFLAGPGGDALGKNSAAEQHGTKKNTSHGATRAPAAPTSSGNGWPSLAELQALVMRCGGGESVPRGGGDAKAPPPAAPLECSPLRFLFEALLRLRLGAPRCAGGGRTRSPPAAALAPQLRRLALRYHPGASSSSTAAGGGGGGGDALAAAVAQLRRPGGVGALSPHAAAALLRTLCDAAASDSPRVRAAADARAAEAELARREAAAAAAEARAERKRAAQDAADACRPLLPLVSLRPGSAATTAAATAGAKKGGRGGAGGGSDAQAAAEKAAALAASLPSTLAALSNRPRVLGSDRHGRRYLRFGCDSAAVYMRSPLPPAPQPPQPPPAVGSASEGALWGWFPLVASDASGGTPTEPCVADVVPLLLRSGEKEGPLRAALASFVAEAADETAAQAAAEAAAARGAGAARDAVWRGSAPACFTDEAPGCATSEAAAAEELAALKSGRDDALKAHKLAKLAAGARKAPLPLPAGWTTDVRACAAPQPAADGCAARLAALVSSLEASASEALGVGGGDDEGAAEEESCFPSEASLIYVFSAAEEDDDAEWDSPPADSDDSSSSDEEEAEADEAEWRKTRGQGAKATEAKHPKSAPLWRHAADRAAWAAKLRGGAASAAGVAEAAWALRLRAEALAK